MYDKVSIIVQGGNGGAGAISFRREKFVPFGGPDGGDGGDGGDVVIKVDAAVTHFKEFRHKGLYRAKNGENGKGEKKSGKRGEDFIVRVPIGTVVYEDSSEGEKYLLADLSTAREEVVVVKGGRGGRGNIHYATSTNQTPRLAQVGEGGEKKLLDLELRLIADIGIIGYPNVGKSSLLTAASAAKPKIADYPFTTKEPELGVVEIGHNAFVLAEIPGLIEGAHQGRGLGYDFLRHSARTKVFIHLVDGSTESPVENMIKVNNELSLYDPALGRRPQIVVVNKVDLPEVRGKREQIVADFANIGVTVRFISAATGEGVQELMRTAFEIVRKKAVSQEPIAPKIFRPQPRRRGTEVSKDGDIFVINAPDIERIILRVDMDDSTVRWQVYGILLRKGISKELEKAGIKGGDKVRCGNAEWDW